MWRNWQTRRLQVPVPFGAWRFDSSHPHYVRIAQILSNSQQKKRAYTELISTGPELARTIISPLLARQLLSLVSILPQTSEPMRLFDAHSASVLFADYIRVLTTSSYLSPQHCPCGFYVPVSRRCKCSPSQIERYMSKISGSLIDRINIHTLFYFFSILYEQ